MKFYGLPPGQGLDRQNDTALILAVQALALVQSQGPS